MKQEDRSRKTKERLAASLKKLIKEKPLSKITVQNIADDCNINRKTFYYHFEDIYDLLKWTLNEEAMVVIGKFDLITEYEEAIRFVMDYVEENDYIINCIYDSVGHDEMKRFLYNDFFQPVRSVIKEIAELRQLPAEDAFTDFLADFYAAGLANLLINWFQDTRRYTRQEIIDDISLIFRESIPAVLKGKASGTKETGKNRQSQT